MRLVTWNLGHRRNGNRCPDRLVTALAALQPDIAILVDHSPGTAFRQLLEALAGAGLKHQLSTTSAAHDGRVLLASRLEIVPGSLAAGDADPMPSDALHGYATNGALDILSLPACRNSRRPSSHEACWNWLLHASATLKHRRAIVVGDFQVDRCGDEPDRSRQLRLFIRDGWQHAVPTEGASYSTAGGDALCADHAFLSPSLQRINTHHALEAAGIRLAGAKDSLSQRPALVVDLQ